MLLTFWCPISAPNKRERESTIEKSNDHGRYTEVHTRCALALGVFGVRFVFVGWRSKVRTQTHSHPPRLGHPPWYPSYSKNHSGGYYCVALVDDTVRTTRDVLIFGFSPRRWCAPGAPLELRCPRAVVGLVGSIRHVLTSDFRG